MQSSIFTTTIATLANIAQQNEPYYNYTNKSDRFTIWMDEASQAPMRFMDNPGSLTSPQEFQALAQDADLTNFEEKENYSTSSTIF